ncbi:Aliphatic sulfonates import ATP-binding protein SsuB [Methyloligella halotolerans]|uniref:Aliphatic sulfonates import ATP-binding protein SsuB n=1 Tax=Methyloligella halotolerans TaxID=1177755 RepID=A0A1E2RZE9_9HYPH|nr:ATP-binding cassette domain-containing protein [Methyloligella halotolerans]ODA67439.1 Aliphatic sulfonates import ATP-binding protein SsuB [Methyloligella halotolerans]
MNVTRPVGETGRFEIDIAEKTYTGANGVPVPVIRDFRLQIKPESMTVLMGPSGCGKTTFLRILAGLDHNFDGSIEMPEETRIGFMFQEPRLLPWRKVRRNIELVADEAFTEEDLLILADALNIADKLDVYPGELSLGLARRAALARAFATRPNLLLLDEPFVSLDEPTADRLRRLLLEVWEARPTTAVLVTHNPREAVMLADELVLLSPRPTHVLETVPVDVPQNERTPAMIEEIYSDLLKRYPENFAA